MTGRPAHTSVNFNTLAKAIHTPKVKQLRLKRIYNESKQIIERKWWLEQQNNTIVENEEYNILIHRLKELLAEARELK